jgi:hypothetical protein
VPRIVVTVRVAARVVGQTLASANIAPKRLACFSVMVSLVSAVALLVGGLPAGIIPVRPA